LPWPRPCTLDDSVAGSTQTTNGDRVGIMSRLTQQQNIDTTIADNVEQVVELGW